VFPGWPVAPVTRACADKPWTCRPVWWVLMNTNRFVAEQRWRRHWQCWDWSLHLSPVSSSRSTPRFQQTILHPVSNLTQLLDLTTSISSSIPDILRSARNFVALVRLLENWNYCVLYGGERRIIGYPVSQKTGHSIVAHNFTEMLTDFQILQWNNFENRSTFGEVTGKSSVPVFWLAGRFETIDERYATWRTEAMSNAYMPRCALR